MIRPPPRSTRTDPCCPSTTLFRARGRPARRGHDPLAGSAVNDVDGRPGVLVAKNAAQCSGITTFELRDRAADKAILALPDAGVDCGNTPVSCRMRIAFVRLGCTVDVVIFEDSLDILWIGRAHV